MTACEVGAVGAHCEILSGFPFDSSRFGDEGHLPLVRIRDVVPGRSSTFYSGDFDERFLVQDGDLLIGMDGEFNRARWRGGRALLNQRVCRVSSTSDRLDDQYLFHFLPGALKRIEAQTPFATVKHLSVKTIRAMRIPLPPIEEQRQIAAVLDQADELRAKRQTSLALIDSFSESVFRQMFGPPSGTRWSGRLGESALFVGGGTPSRARPEYYDGEICWATSKDMKSRYVDDTQEHITEEAIASSATKLVPAGSVLIVVKSKVLAHSLPVAVTRVDCCFGQDLKAVMPRTGWRSYFLAEALRVGRRWLLDRARGVNTEGLTLAHLNSFPVPLASSAEQEEFEQRVLASERLATAGGASFRELNSMCSSLQHWAFPGQL